MAKVKGSKHEQLVLKPHRPLRDWLIGILWVVAAVILIASAVFFGRYQERQAQMLDSAERQRLYNTLSKVAVMEQDQRVDRLALEDSRQAIKELEEKVYELNKALSFYRSIMEPEEGKIGLQVTNLELESLPGDRMRLSWILAQVGRKQSLITGHVEVRLHGNGASQQTMLSLKELVGKDLNSQFKFRYFQKFSVDFEIPVDYSAHEIEIYAQTEGKKVQTVSRKLNWVAPERVADVAQ